MPPLLRIDRDQRSRILDLGDLVDLRESEGVGLYRVVECRDRGGLGDGGGRLLAVGDDEERADVLDRELQDVAALLLELRRRRRRVRDEAGGRVDLLLLLLAGLGALDLRDRGRQLGRLLEALDPFGRVRNAAAACAASATPLGPSTVFTSHSSTAFVIFVRLSPTPQFMRLDATLHFLGSAGGSAGLALFAGVSFGVASFFSMRGRPRLGGFTDV